MKSNELFEKIHSGEIKENTKIEVKTESGEHIAFVIYECQRLNWISGEFDTRYLCDIDTEFEIVKNSWEIEKLTRQGMVGDRVNALEDKVDEVIDKLNKRNEPLPF